MKVKILLLFLIVVFTVFILLNIKKSEYTSEIPKIIHQTAMADQSKWKQEWFRCQKSWQEKFPDFEYKMWNDEDLDDFIKTKYPWFYDTYTGYDVNIKRFDAARYFILYEYGGMYADMDFECIENFWDQIPQDRVSIAESATKDEGFQNALMISPKGHPFWEFAFTDLKDNPNKNADVILVTGPQLINRCYLKNMNYVNILPKEKYSVIGGQDTVYISGNETDKRDGVYSIHHGSCSWCT